ncbi:MAG: DUF3307 domain-containing protein [Chryseosolibacter sp.]
MILLMKLLLAHLAGDFLLQPDRWVTDKQLKKHRSAKLYFHVLVHAALTFLLVWDLSFWLPVLVILVTHYFIDLLKVNLEKPRTKIFWFITDQLLHLFVIIMIWYTWEQPALSGDNFPLAHVLIIATAAVFLTNPTSVIIKTFISQWTPDTLYTVTSSLPDAGKIIGFLERLLVLTFILNQHWEAVGFLLAAKSVFRFGNLKESHDRKLTEYVLIGTLLSFGIALAVSLITLALLTTTAP